MIHGESSSARHGPTGGWCACTDPARRVRVVRALGGALVVVAALALLIWAAILDGRYAAAQKLGDGQQVLAEADRGPMVAA
jgi:hypothetical protein